MNTPAPLTLRSRRRFQLFLWTLTLFCGIASIGVLVRALAWMPLIPEEPTLLALLLPVGLLVALAFWLGRWALFHTTVRVEIDDQGLRMESAVARDLIQWEQVEEIRLQATSGSEAQLLGQGHRVTLPSGSAPHPDLHQQAQDWISYRLDERDLKFGDEHFWGP
jgi:hypothetical protein